MVKKFGHLLMALTLIAVTGFADEDQQTKNKEKKLPIGAELYVSQNVGAGTAFKRYQQDPYVASNLEVFPYYKYGPFGGDREIKVHAEIKTYFEWMGEGNPFLGSVANKFNIKDIKLRAELKNALYAKELGLSLTPGVKLEAPASKASRSSNRVIGFGGFLTAAWSKWGVFASYKPVMVGYAYSDPFKSGDCSDASLEDDKLGNGKCKVSGRQTMAVLKNGISAGYTNGNHSVTLLFRTYHSFLRAAGRGEKTEKKAQAGVMEATLGVIEYAYKMPFDVPTTVMLGLSGEQGYYDAALGLRMPFFNFTEPAKNLTEAYVAVNMSI